jgi:broad specificity phosphatase PhoE
VYEDSDLTIDFDEFWRMYENATAIPYGFLYVDTRNDQFRSGFHEIIELQRCVQTAVPLANELGLEPIETELWRERDVGDFSGMTGDQARKNYPEIWAQAVRGMIDPPNGEPFADVQARAWRAFETVAEAHSEGMVAVITHGGFLHALLGQVMGIDPEIYGRFSIRGNTGLSIVEVNDRGPVVTLLNDTSHLEN